MKRKLLACSIFLLTSVLVFGQNKETKILTVEDAVSLALENNLSIKQSKMDLDLLKAKNNSSWNSISPSLSLSGGVNGGKSGKLDTFSDAKETLNWSAGASVMLSLSPSLATSIKAARLSYEAGELSYENTKRTIELNVRKTFYSLVYFNENLELQQRSLQTAKQTYEANQSKYNQGRLSELNLLNSQYNYESKIPTVENLKTSYETNLDNFKIILGINITDDIQLTGSLDEALNFILDENNISYDLEELPAIKSAMLKIESQKNSLNATRFSAWGPSVSLSGSVNTGAGIEPKSDQTLQVSYSATVKIPLDGYLPWSNGALNVKSQKESLEKMNQDLESTKTSTALSIKNSINSIKQAKTQLDLYEKNAGLMQKTYEMSLNSYNAGSTDLLSLQNAQNNFYQAKYNVQNQKYSIISAVLELENTLGLDFGSLNNTTK